MTEQFIPPHTHTHTHTQPVPHPSNGQTLHFIKASRLFSANQSFFINVTNHSHDLRASFSLVFLLQNIVAQRHTRKYFSSSHQLKTNALNGRWLSRGSDIHANPLYCKPCDKPQNRPITQEEITGQFTGTDDSIEFSFWILLSDNSNAKQMPL